jgi:hypothetical protein
VTSRSPNVVIVMARCSRSRNTFGIRVEEKHNGQWLADWAFALKETTARKEGYGRSEIAGVIKLDLAYPGCPHCHAMGLVKCSCGHVACWDRDRNMVSCPWCGSTGEVSGSIHSLSGESDL